MRYVCLDQIDNDYRKCIYYQVSSSLLSYIISFCMRKASDYTIIFVRISNIEVKSNFDILLNSKFDFRQGSNMSLDEMNDTNATATSKQSWSSNLSGNIKVSNGVTQLKPISNNNQTQNNSLLKDSNTKITISKDNEEEIISQNLSCKDNDVKLKLHETKIFSMVKDVLSFERDNMLKIIKSITKKHNQEYSIKESKVFKVDYKKLAYIISDIRKLIQIWNDNGGFIEEGNSEAKLPVYTVLEDKDSSKNSFSVYNNIYKYKVKIALEKFIIDEFHAEISYILQMDTLTQRYEYLIKKIDENFCFVELTLLLKGKNIEEIMNNYKLFKVKLVLITLEKHIKMIKWALY